MNNTRYFITAIVLLLFSQFALAQTTTLNYKQKGKTTYQLEIYLSDEKSNPIVTASQFLASDKVFFTLKPNALSEREYFKESDLEDELAGLALYQQDKIESIAAPMALLENKKITRLILSYPKNAVKLWEPFVFKVREFLADPIKIEESYFDDYTFYQEQMQLQNTLEKEGKNVELLDLSYELIQKADSSLFFKRYSFYETMTQTYPMKAISSGIEALKKEYAAVEESLHKTWSRTDLKKLDDLAIKTEEFLSHADIFITLKPKSIEAQKLIKATRQTLAEKQAVNFQQFASKKTQIIENGRFDQYQYRLFIDLIYKAILQNSGFVSVKRNLSLDKSMDAKDAENLEATGWKTSFEDMLFVLKYQQSLHDTNVFFNESVINNLQDQLANQSKPYFEVILAANSAVRGTEIFMELMNQAIDKCPVAEELSQMELLKLTYSLTEEEMPGNIAGNLNLGIKKMQESKWKEADFSFELAIRQFSQFAPAWYYLGYCEMKLGEVFSAQSRIDQALLLNPHYLTPKLFSFGILKEQGDYAKILLLSKESLAIQKSYLNYLWKAEAHLFLKQYNEAIESIQQGCLIQNPNHESAYYLLGDVYAAMKKYDLAKEAYLKTQQINPFESNLFNEKMSALPAGKP